ncbi:class II aldolase/adducin family protein [Micromonospora sp. SH-82]|uniref:class II aldolase/adducin family protein n=1 Tax=Micromonospora sp. SH-82 TaxID=3132938 RepID=UPI003EC03CA2
MSTSPPSHHDGLDLTDVDRARGELVRAVRTLFAAGVMSHSGHGNISVRLRSSPEHVVLNRGDLLVAPADADPTAGARVISADVVVVDLDGRVVLGEPGRFTAGITRMHTEVYRLRPDVGAIVHTHSPQATGYAIAATPLPARYEALLVHGQPVDVPVAPWGPRGSTEAVQGIVDTFAAHPRTQAVLLANHGLLVAGNDAAHAARLVVAIEEAAVSTLASTTLGGPADLPPAARHEKPLAF